MKKNNMINSSILTDTLWNEGILKNNQFLVSSNGKYYARMQDDGNLCIYMGKDPEVYNCFWCSIPLRIGKAPYYLKMQNDGNLVIYDGNSKAIWASNTDKKGSGPYKLVMQNDRNLVIYDKSNQTIWISATQIYI